GHSTRTLDEFVGLLRAHGITQLADVRTVPKSRRHPHFAGEALAVSLPAAGVAYRRFAGLGGLRKPRKDSQNTGWRHESFRGYADHMQSPAFREALDELIEWSSVPTVVMCAEAVWWQCHRQLIADALVARGIEVRHIMSATSAPAPVLNVGRARERRAGDLSGPDLTAAHEAGRARGRLLSRTRGSVRRLLGPAARPFLGLLAGFGDEHDRAGRFAAAVAADPCDPVRTARFAVNLIIAGRGGHARKNLGDWRGSGEIPRFWPDLHCVRHDHFI